ncbi:hypothetical protein GCM10028777_11710 [Angustibacter speluncae]
MRTPGAVRRLGLRAAAAALIVGLAGCAGGTEPAAVTSGSKPAAPSTSPVAAPPTTSVPAPTSTADASPDQVVGTVVRFTSERTSVDVTIGEDSPATRDFLSMLPLELGVEEYAGAEKIAYLPRELAYEGTAGSDPEDGDLIYFTPWGNLGFYYDTSGVDYSDATLHLGTYQADRDQLALLEGERVTVDVVP